MPDPTGPVPEPGSADHGVAALVAAARDGRPRAIGRLISAIENDSGMVPGIVAALAHDTGRATVIGLTGPPGVGKSTTTSALVRAYRRDGRRVAVLAVDPSSPFSGGALLGDRVRMQEHALDPGVYIRSMATRGHLGGLAVAAPQALRVFDAAGFDVVLLETVGVGQSEVEVAGTADVTAVLLAPGMGDGVQTAKAGILEVGDVYVVNKSDREGAHAVVRELRSMLALADRGPDDWRPPIVSTIASQGEGILELVGALDHFLARQRRTGDLQRRRHARARRELEGLLLLRLRRDLTLPGGVDLDGLAAAVSRGELDPYTAADRLSAGLAGGAAGGGVAART